MHEYFAYIFHIQSDFILPLDKINMPRMLELNSLKIEKREERIVELTDLIAYRSRFNGGYRVYHTSKGSLICISDFLQLFVDKSGDNIKVYCKPHMSEEASLYIVGVGLVLCLLYKEYIPLHASAVCLDDQLFIFLAPKSSGKSTLVWSLLEGENINFFSDDLIPVKWNGNKLIGYPSLSIGSKLDANSLKLLGQEYFDLTKVSKDSRKFWCFASEERRMKKPLVVKEVFFLQPNHKEEHVTFKKVEISEKLPRLINNTQSLWLLSDHLLEPIISQYIKLANTSNMYIISYPKTYDSLLCMGEEIMEFVK